MTDNRTILSEELESALCAPNWAASLAHVHAAIDALTALPTVGGWMDIEEAKKQKYVLARVSHDG